MLTCFHNSPGFVVGDLKQPDVLPVGEKDVGSCDAGVQAGQQHQPGHQPARGHAAAQGWQLFGRGRVRFTPSCYFPSMPSVTLVLSESIILLFSLPSLNLYPVSNNLGPAILLSAHDSEIIA